MSFFPVLADLPDLSVLRAEWAKRRIAVLAAKATIDPSGMTRPRRDPIELAWLEAHGMSGPFHEIDLPRVLRST